MRQVQSDIINKNANKTFMQPTANSIDKQSKQTNPVEEKNVFKTENNKNTDARKSNDKILQLYSMQQIKHNPDLVAHNYVKKVIDPFFFDGQ